MNHSADFFRSLTLAALLLVAPAHATEQNLPDQFNEIRESVLETVTDSQHTGAAATYQLLQGNLAAFRSLSARVSEAPHLDSVIEELATELDIIASNFERAEKLRDTYSKDIAESRQLMAQRFKETQSAIAEIDRRIQHNAQELQRAQSSLPTGKLERDRKQIIIRSNQSVLNSLEAQRQIWLRFADAQQRLMSTFTDGTEQVEFVLFVLELRRNIRLALQDLQALGAIESSLTDLATSWREVDAIVSEIGRQEFASYAGH